MPKVGAGAGGGGEVVLMKAPSAQDSAPTGIVAVTVLLAVAITEMLPGRYLSLSVFN